MDLQIIKNPVNKDRIAVVAVGYNRLNSLKRLLNSIENAMYHTSNVPLIISIDASGDKELYNYVNNYKWKKGELIVNIQQERLGLKRHIYQCCDLTKYFKAVIILEDDIYVSPYFYEYTKQAIEVYGDDPTVCGIALYSPTANGYIGLPFIPLQTGADVYLYQDVCTWGECFTYNMWKKFRDWLQTNEERDYYELEMPSAIKRWSRAWSKYYYAYMIENNMAFITPYISYTTNFSDAGEHGKSTNKVQVPMQWGEKRFNFMSVDKLIKYDAYSNNTLLYDILGLDKSNLTLDLYGNNQNYVTRRYLLSSRRLPYRLIASYGLKLFPIELNIVKSIQGAGIYLYDLSIKDSIPHGNNSQILHYYLGKINPRLVMRYFFSLCKDTIQRKLKIR